MHLRQAVQDEQLQQALDELPEADEGTCAP